MMRINEVLELSGLSRSSLIRYEKAGLFPLRRRLGLRSVGWVESEVKRWLYTHAQVKEKKNNDTHARQN